MVSVFGVVQERHVHCFKSSVCVCVYGGWGGGFSVSGVVQEGHVHCFKACLQCVCVGGEGGGVRGHSVFGVVPEGAVCCVCVCVGGDWRGVGGGGEGVRVFFELCRKDMPTASKAVCSVCVCGEEGGGGSGGSVYLEMCRDDMSTTSKLLLSVCVGRGGEVIVFGVVQEFVHCSKAACFVCMCEGGGGGWCTVYLGLCRNDMPTASKAACCVGGWRGWGASVYLGLCRNDMSTASKAVCCACRWWGEEGGVSVFWVVQE